MFKRLPIMILIPLALAGTACGGGDEPATVDEAPVPTSVPLATTPPATEPPTTAPPTSAPEPSVPASNPPPKGGELPDEFVEIDDGAYDTIGEMGEAAEVIVVATVTGERPISPGRTDMYPLPEAYLGLQLRVDEVLQGDPGDEIRLAWYAYTLDEDGNSVAANVLNGIPVPHVGDQLVVFLRVADSAFAEALDGFPTHAPVLLDAIGFVENGAVTITDSVVADAAVLTGVTLDEIRASI